jgi:rhamnosyltransferase subunit B
MARIVFTTWGSLGDLHPYMALALELKGRGHDPIVATLPIARENVERAGLEFRPIRPDVSPDDLNSRDLVRKILDVRTGPEFLFKQVLAPHMRETYDDTLAAVKGAELLVSHQLPITSPIVAEQTGIRWVSGILAPMGFLSAYDPPTLPHALWLRQVGLWHPTIGGAIRQIARAVTRPWVKSWYQLRKDLGMPPDGHPLFEGQHSPSCVLALFSRLLAVIQPDYPPQTVITGFPFYDAAPEHPPDAGLLRFLDAGEPPIVFTLGSSAVWIADDFYAVSMAAARALGRRALLLVGQDAAAMRARAAELLVGENAAAMRARAAELLVGQDVAAMRAQAPDGIGVFDYAPHSTVMPRAGVIVHQGGIGTTAQALRAGRPMLVVPFGQDQPDNARRVVALGVARTISRGRYQIDRVTSELSALLSDSGYAERAAAVGELVRAERGAERACDEIERVLES